MPNSTYDWIVRLKSVELEFKATSFSTNRVLSEVKRDTTILERELDVGDLNRAIEHLEGTFIVRLFAEFETCLRRYWNKDRPIAKKTPAEVLLDRVGGKSLVPQNLISKTHNVRELRNLLIHERDEEIQTMILIGDARHHLCTFLSYLPREW